MTLRERMRRLPPTFYLGVLVGALALLVAGGIEIMRPSAAPGPQPGPTGTVLARTTGTAFVLPTTDGATPVATVPAGATSFPLAFSDPTETPAVDGPSVVALEDSLTFDDTTPNATSTEKTVTLSNEGGGPQPLGTLTIDGANPGAFAISTNECGDSLDGLAQCDLGVTFSPPDAGDYSATLEIVDPQSNTLASVSLSGHGGSSNPGSDISISPDTLSLDTQAGITASGTIDIANNGTASITVSEELDDGGGVFSIAGNCNSEIAAGSDCFESVQITPPDQCNDANYSGSITFTDDAGDQLSTASLTSSATGDQNQCSSS